MLILAIDIGKGTEDLLIYDTSKTLENSIQVVWPSSANLMYQKLSTKQFDKLLFAGELMAGEPWHKIVYEYSKNQNQVFMTPESARSLKYNLDRVTEKGVNVVSEDEITKLGGPNLVTRDIIWERVNSLLEFNNLQKEDISIILLACQDHGDPTLKTQSVKDFRMDVVYSEMNQSGRLEDLIFPYSQIPDSLPRHLAVASSALVNFPHLDKSKIWVMDSSPAVILGAVRNTDHELIVNAGNGHTLAVILEDQLVQAVYETHTGRITSDSFFDDLRNLIKNSLSHEQAIKNGAHGVYQRSSIKRAEISDYFPFTLIGPNRSKLSYENIYLAHPGGSMMMAGPIGLIKAHSYKTNSEFKLKNV